MLSCVCKQPECQMTSDYRMKKMVNAPEIMTFIKGPIETE